MASAQASDGLATPPERLRDLRDVGGLGRWVGSDCKFYFHRRILTKPVGTCTLIPSREKDGFGIGVPIE